jgi:hypothetical protein
MDWATPGQRDGRGANVPTDWRSVRVGAADTYRDRAAGQ